MKSLCLFQWETRKVYKITKYFTQFSSLTEIPFFSRYFQYFKGSFILYFTCISLIVITAVHWFYVYPENSFHSSRNVPMTWWSFYSIWLCDGFLFLHSLLTPSKCSSSLLTTSAFHSFTIISLLFVFICFKLNAC